MDRVETKDEIVRNVRLFNTYRSSGRPDQEAFFKDRLRLGKRFVYLTPGVDGMFCPSRFAGYRSNTMPRHIAFDDKHGGLTTPQITSIVGSGHSANTQAETHYLRLCTTLNIEPTKTTRTYWTLDSSGAKIPFQNPAHDSDSGFPDEVQPSTTYAEGACKTVTVNAYERNPEARKKCIQHHGAKCLVCHFDFLAVYGEIGRDFTHVHHLHPIALRQTEYKVNPLSDLVPVCPNCHAMLHKSDPPFTIEELRELRGRAGER